MTTMRLLTIGSLLTLLGGVAAAQEQPVDPYNQPQQQPYYDDQGQPTYDDQGDQGDDYDPQAYTQFEGSLAPYGQWSDDATYGRIWSPAQTVVGVDFSPYATNGHWVMTEYGWTWVSDWDWGWAPFHYGRWVNLSARGWCWVPGRTWGPGWVRWRSGYGNVGWAPLAPRVAVRDHRVAAPGWRFTPSAQVGQQRMGYYPAHTTPWMMNRTQVVRSAPVRYQGPPVRYNAPVRYMGPPVRYNAPQVHYSAPRYSAPMHYSAPAHYSAPMHYSTPAHYSAPMHYSAPAHYSAPMHYSAPAHYSAPQVRSHFGRR
jgi:hypothetical protein